MLENQWYAILESKEVKKKPMALKRLNKRLVIYKLGTEIICLEDVCVHRGSRLHRGKIKGECIECPFHGFQFDKDGKCQTIPANGISARIPKRFKQRKYKIKEKDGFIFMFNGEYEKADEVELVYFDELADSNFSYHTIQKTWHTNYTRCIENQLDVAHLPFIHKSTIGRGDKTLVNGPKVEWQKNKMHLFVFNEKDEGQKPLKASAMKNNEEYFNLQFIFPNIWQNVISDVVRITVAFVPVDEETTILYLRFYQSFLNVPVLKNIINYSVNIFNKKVLKEDHDVVIGQYPKETYFNMKEELIPADLPIGEFRRRRMELKNKNN